MGKKRCQFDDGHQKWIEHPCPNLATHKVIGRGYGFNVCDEHAKVYRGQIVKM